MTSVKIKRFYLKHDQFLRFFMIGSLNTALDLVLFFIFANLFAIYAVYASLISTSLVMILSFFLNNTFVFRSSKKKRETVVQFMAITLFNVWIIQSIIIALVIKYLSIDFLLNHRWFLNIIAKLLAVSLSFILNFVEYRYIFHQKKIDITTTL